MFPYWMLFAAFAVPAALSHKAIERRSTLGFVVAAAILIVIIGFRYRVGGDWNGYVGMFARIQMMNVSGALQLTDPAYGLLNWFAARVGGGIILVDVICAAIFTYGLLILCRDQASPALAILVAIPYLVIVVAMGYTRQAAALGLVMAALSRYQRGALLTTTLLLAAAIAFHKSAIVVGPMLALASSKTKVLSFFLLALLIVTTYYVFVSSSVDKLMHNYVGAKYNSSGALIRILMNIVPAILFFLFRNRLPIEGQNRKLWAIFAIGSVVSLIGFILSPSSTAVDRLSIYLIPLQIVVLAGLPYVFARGGSVALRALVMLYCFSVQYTWLNFGDNARAWLPYRNYVTEQEA